MDIVAKHVPADRDGVRIAALDETRYRRLLWDHRPLTDFWRVGRGYAKKLEAAGLSTMGDIARCSVNSEDLLYKMFGVSGYAGLVTTDGYGRKIPKHAHGSANLDRPTSSVRLIAGAATELFDRIVSRDLLARRLNVVANHTVDESCAARYSMEQLDLFGGMEAKEREDEALARERRIQEAVLGIRRRYGMWARPQRCLAREMSMFFTWTPYVSLTQSTMSL